jgi:signal peptidase I
MREQTDATEPSAVHDSKPIPSRAMVLSVWLRDLIISLAISCFIIVFLYQPVKVEGTSMMPSLEDQERIFVNKFVYRLEPIERGDIIVFRYPRDPSKSFIKRVIGLAGDHIQIDAGRVLREWQADRGRLRTPCLRGRAIVRRSRRSGGQLFCAG